jgi:cellulose biosynthesis protein BcsQ
MKTLAIINQKGGVGKSTTCRNVGAGLALKGHKVLYIDLDAQGNLTHTLGVSNPTHNALDLLQKTVSVSEAITSTTHTPQVDIAEGSLFRLKLMRLKYDDMIGLELPPS